MSLYRHALRCNGSTLLIFEERAVMNSRFAMVGALAGLVMTMTMGWLITGYLCHGFQRATPSTWRTERWSQHALAMLWSGIGGAILGTFDAQVAWSHSSAASAMTFAALIWGAVAGPVIATIATYVNLHLIVVAGLLLEWLLFALGVSMACWAWGN
jgi:hypothetical protein